MTVLFGTGHRPEDANLSFEEMTELASTFLWAGEFSAVVSGMAAGFDLALAASAIKLSIPVWTVRPWAGHVPRNEDRMRYQWIQERAARHFDTNDSFDYPGPGVYQARNVQMVDMAEEGAAFWSGKLNGGTFNCLKYAVKKQKKRVYNIYPDREGMVNEEHLHI